MIYTFKYDRTIDAKNRLQIPAQFRKRGAEREAFYICPGVRENTLSLYQEPYFEQRASQIQTEYMAEPDSLEFEQAFFAAVVRQELDSQGRINIPDDLLEMVDLGREVVLAGAKVRIDIWRKSDFDELRRSIRSRWDVFQKYLRMGPPGAADEGPQ